MKTNSRMGKIKVYLKELTIVTIGVLIALIISNFKENYQARKYQIASIETIKNEIEANYSDLKGAIEDQTRLLDTINKYRMDNIPIGKLIEIANGLQVANLSNTGLEFYKKNQIISIDFEMTTILINMNTLSEIIDSKEEKLVDYLYPNIFNNSEESKMLFTIYLKILLGTEAELMHNYENFINDYIKTTHNKS